MNKLNSKAQELSKTGTLSEIYTFVKANNEKLDDLDWDTALKLTNKLIGMPKLKKVDAFKIANAVYILGFGGKAYQIANKTKDEEIIDLMQKLVIEGEDSDSIINFAKLIPTADKKAMIFYMLRLDMYEELVDFAIAFPDYRDYIMDIFKEEALADYIKDLLSKEEYNEKVASGEINPDDNLSDKELGIDWDSIY